MENLSAGARFRYLLTANEPLQLVGAINANHALLAKEAGFKAIYLSGGGVAAGSLGIPDLGITTLDDVLTDINRITNVCDLPLIVDIDTGFGASAFNIARTIKNVWKAGAAGVHVEDQVVAKRCGHRPNKQNVSTEEMVDRIRAAVSAKEDPSFVIGARTDAIANEGIESAIQRCKAYQSAGADFIFAEAVNNLEDYARFAEALDVPILANITEFGQTPLFTVDELKANGVSIVLYPLSAFRAANKAAANVYKTIFEEGSQKSALPNMQTREELYKNINYYYYEDYLNQQQNEGN